MFNERLIDLSILFIEAKLNQELNLEDLGLNFATNLAKKVNL
jgi:hypothetical protein